MLTRRVSALGSYWSNPAQDLVVVPSISFPAQQLNKVPGIEHYEERLLYHLFHLRHSFDSRVLYITSLPLDNAILEYYLRLTLDSMHGESELGFVEKQGLLDNLRSRLVVLSCYDARRTHSLTQKILQRPRLLKRIQGFLEGSKLRESSSFSQSLSVYRGTEAEFELGAKLGLGVHASQPQFLHWGGKAGSRLCFLKTGVPHADGTYAAEKDVDKLIDDILVVCLRNPASRKGMVKLDEGFSGKGNAALNLSELSDFIKARGKDLDAQERQKARSLVIKALETARFYSLTESWPSFLKQIPQVGAIFELFIETPHGDPVVTSPSVQVCIEDLGNVEILSTHEQILDSQHFIGMSFCNLQRFSV
jgi:hypothetical protein